MGSKEERSKWNHHGVSDVAGNTDFFFFNLSKDVGAHLRSFVKTYI